jgi:chromosome segregation ATPase
MAFCTVSVFSADKVNPAEQKMRESLRNAMIQLRDANGKLAAAQAALAESDEKAKQLQADLEDLTKKSSAEKRASTEAIDDLKTKLALSEQQNNHLSASLAKWKEGYSKLADYAKQTEAKRAELASKAILLDRKVADQRTKNAEMFRLANEVLDRYAQFGLGTAITAREPFVGITRTKFENLVQEYQQKLSKETIRNEESDSTPSR